ncbi:MAG: PH domain-containing protein [Parvularculaceae bacterium]|nr:PH domain-containing protein [Parvularculaceae bacterium]
MDGGHGERLLRPYVLKSLPAGERLLALARFPWALRWFAWGLLLILGVAPIFGLFALYAIEKLTVPIAVILLALSVIGAVIFLCIEAWLLTTEFGLTTQRIVVKRGVFGRETTEMPLHAVENIKLNQSVMARVFGYGWLEIFGSGGGRLCSPVIAKPMAFRAAIDQACAQAGHELQSR